MVIFSHSQYSLRSVFYKVKTFSIRTICYEKSIHLSSVQEKLPKNLFGVSWDLIFIYSSLKFPGKSTVLSINVDVFLKPSLLEESLSQKKSEISLFCV